MKNIELQTTEQQTPAHYRNGVAIKELEQTIKLCQEYLLGQQYDEGYWWAELESNVTITAEYLLLTHIFDMRDQKRWDQIVNYLKSKQRPDGTWSIYYDGPPDLNCAVEAYFAMKLASVSPDEPFMRKAREFILSRGGVQSTRNFTKIWLALCGQWEWDALPVMPPEIIFLPSALPFNIYEFSSWARATMVPMTIILTMRPTNPVPEYARIDELFPSGSEPISYTVRGEPDVVSWQRAFIEINKLLRARERTSFKPGREEAIKKAEQWILDHQEADGCWGGIQPPWVYSLIALKCLGYPVDHPAIMKGFEAFEGPKGFGIEEDGTFRTQSCLSPVWDTAWATIALRESGLPADYPSLVKTGKWLLKEQITVDGDWSIKWPEGVPGGWAFEFENDWYPDIDDAAEVLIAINLLDLPQVEKDRALKLGVDWLLGMQSGNGGWGAFDKDNDKLFVTTIPFCDFGEVIDPPSVDVTAHILELLAILGYRIEDYPAMRRGLHYIKREQEADGSWFGRWGVNYIYGTGAVLPALKAIGEDMSEPYVRRAIDWLKARQNSDGGWGETCASYDDPSLNGQGPSTASQTAWALLGLLAAGETASQATQNGVRYLVTTQSKDGSWEEDHFTGTGFPGDFLIKYHMYRIYFPVLALGRYRRYVRQGNDSGV